MRVTILLLEQISLFEMACAVEIFALPRPEIDNWYTTQIVSLTQKNFRGLCETGFSCKKVEELPECDVLVIPSFPVSIVTPEPIIKEQIMKHYNRGGRILSFCSGSFLLAALGILDNRTAVTHWRYAIEFKKRFPNINYQDNILYEYDGTIGCSAGSASGIDLSIEMIRQDYGYNIANSVARRLVLPAHRLGGQSQFVEKPLTKTKSSVSQALDWAVKNLSAELSIKDIANKANMTRRTFDRHFKKNYNMTPLLWLRERKLEVAQKLLETSNLSIEHIAVQSGFDNAVTMRHNFKSSLSISPSEYKTTFRETK